MIAYSVVILCAWVGSIFIPFFFVGFEDSQHHNYSEDSHFLRG